MTVYVDNMRAPYGRMIMCHCWADTREELFAMMDAIGIPTKWFQQPPKASWEHFDISLSKRAEAVRRGAVETDKYGPVVHVAMRRLNVAVLNCDVPGMVRQINMLLTVHKCRVMR